MAQTSTLTPSSELEVARQARFTGTDSKGISIPGLATNPTSPVDNEFYHNTGDNTLRLYTGLVWKSFVAGGGSGGSTDLDGAYSNGQSINIDQGAMTLNDASAAALNTLALVKTGAGSGNLIDLSVDAALTGSAIALDMNLGIAAPAISIDNGGTARTGADIIVTDDSTGNHSVIDINSSGAGATVGFDFTGSYTGSPAGQAIKVTLDANDNLDTEIMEVTTGAGARSIMFDLNFGHTDSGTTSHIFDIDVTGILDSNIFDFATSAACTGNVLNINLDTSVAMTALHIEGSGSRTQPFVELISDCTGAANMIQLTASGAFTGDFLALDMNAAVGANAIFLDAGNATRTVPMVLVTFDGSGDTTGGTLFDINVTNTGATANPLFDIDVTGVYTGSIFDVALGAAATGTVFAADMNLGVAAAFMTIDAGGTTRTVDLIDVTFDGDGNVGFLDLNCTNTGSGNLIDVAVTGVHTGNILNLAYSSAASTGEAVSIAMGTNVAGSALNITAAGARTDDLIKIEDSSTGNSHIFDINFSGIYTGNCLDVTYASAAATGNAIDLNMGTNVAGMAVSIGSAATGTSGEGSCLDIVHTGDLGAGADVVRIRSTGNISSTSNLVEIVQDTGAGSAGANALYINATGTNVEAIKVDAGTVVFDETLTVTGLATLTAGIDAAVIFAGTETIAAGGTSTALSLTKTIHDIDADAGGDIFTLADGTAGQIAICVLKTATGVATITPATFLGGTSITLNAAGDSVSLVYTANGWVIFGGNSYAIS